MFRLVWWKCCSPKLSIRLPAFLSRCGFFCNCFVIREYHIHSLFISFHILTVMFWKTNRSKTANAIERYCNESSIHTGTKIITKNSCFVHRYRHSCIVNVATSLLDWTLFWEFGRLKIGDLLLLVNPDGLLLKDDGDCPEFGVPALRLDWQINWSSICSVHGTSFQSPVSHSSTHSIPPEDCGRVRAAITVMFDSVENSIVKKYYPSLSKRSLVAQWKPR